MIAPIVAYAPPPPMDEVRRAHVHLPDALNAITRAQAAWNARQVEDALDSAERFIRLARAGLAESKP